MTNEQLLLTIGIPSLLVVLSWINNNSRFDGIDKRLDGHDARFDRADARFDRVDAKIERLTESTRSDALMIMKELTELHERVAVVETRQAGQ
jgi:uncharacterized protein YdcH (DUF465 family)